MFTDDDVALAAFGMDALASIEEGGRLREVRRVTGCSESSA